MILHVVNLKYTRLETHSMQGKYQHVHFSGVNLNRLLRLECIQY